MVPHIRFICKHNDSPFPPLVFLFFIIILFSLQGCSKDFIDIPGTAISEEGDFEAPTDQIPIVQSIIETRVTERPQSIEPTSLPTTAPTPLRFTFPTIAFEPISIWRPPLYPTPWEPTPYDHFYFSRPIGANEINWPLPNYRYGGTFFENVVHTGIDIPATLGTPIMAAGSGKVIWAGFGLYFLKEEFSDPYGLAIAIKHDFGYQGSSLYTVYGHLDRISVVRGQVVEGGEIIGTMGQTGQVTGPHLHFEVRIGDNTFFVTRNPELWITPPQGWGILAGRIMETNGDLLIRYPLNIRSLETNQHWSVNTYGSGSVNSDPYYRENMVIGDLPAGEYLVMINYEGNLYTSEFNILPGMVTYMRFVGRFGFDSRQPSTLEKEFIPPDVSPTSTP